MFMMLEGLFKPSVMFFELINSLATSQAMMNKILRNLINTRKTVSFIGNVIVEIKEEDNHDKIVIKRLEENDLYVNQKNTNKRSRK